MIFYAKSKPDILTIAEHTNDVVEGVEVLRRTYGERLFHLTNLDWQLLKLAALYHDLGKYSDGFQNKIQSAIHKLEQSQLDNYPHNYLSVSLIPFKELEKQEKFSIKDSELLALIVGYHHERERKPSTNEITTIYEQQLTQHLSQIESEINIKVSRKPDKVLLKTLENREKIYEQKSESDIKKFRYILLKGLLHRADFAASAKRKHEAIDDYIEQGVNQSVGMSTNQFFKNNNFSKRELQLFTESNQDKNILLVAQTGSGKTEAALMWIGQDKGFITLPLRVSLNAMFDRIRNKEDIGFEHTRLLHSGAFDHLFHNEKEGINEEDAYTFTTQQVAYAQLLSSKLTLSTIDQIFKFPLLYKGFERELATLAYSKVVIDEIQAYDPHIVAILIQGIDTLTKLGGKWMIMTATLPAIFKEELNKRGLLDSSTTAETTILLPDDLTKHQDAVPIRHRVKLLNCSILDSIEEISEKAITRKVLVVVNTVVRALKVYDALKENNEIEVHLLHSQFITRDRSKKEATIKTFGQLHHTKPGVWVTTQIVEASIDVDFDYLFTEAATPDALFQRFGRCNRKGKRPALYNEGHTPTSPNIFICTEDITGLDSIYEQTIVENGLTALKAFDGELIDEQAKLDIVSQVFSREHLQDTKYLQTFDSALDELKSITPFKLDNKQAQKILRDIKSVMIVPGLALLEEVTKLTEQYYAIPREQPELRKKLMRDIYQLTVSVNESRLLYRKKEHGFIVRPLDNRAFSHIYYAAVKYSTHRGLELACDDVDSRFF